MFAEELKLELDKVLKKLQIRGVKIALEHPADLNFGDYSTNIALIATKRQRDTEAKKFESPRDLAEQILKTWQEMGFPNFVEKVEVAGPGFINIWLKIESLSRELTKVLERGDQYGSSKILAGREILLEHTSPNPQTTIMLGHLRNNFLGMSVAKILTFVGAKMTLDDIVNDRGVHICRAILGYLTFAKKGILERGEINSFREISEPRIEEISSKVDWSKLLEEWLHKKEGWWQPEELDLKPDHANLRWYVLGSRAYRASTEVRKQVEEILIAWEKEDKQVREIWRQLLDWVEKGYAETYQRIGSHHDWVWYESNHWKKGIEIVEEGRKKGVFKESKGAIVTDLGKFGLPDTVVVKSDGTALYMTQDLALTKLKKEKFPSDLYIWDIGMEQTLYFKQLFTVVDQLGIIERAKLFHLSYALINFKGGGKKMATRRGDVVIADEILDELHRRTLETIKSSNQELRGKLSEAELNDIAEKVAVGAVKYSLLKYSRETTMFFDVAESLALQGNSGPYLQYTYARTQSVLRKWQDGKDTEWQGKINFETLKLCRFAAEEEVLLRTFYKFPEVIVETAKTYSPNLLCNFLFDLAQKFNLFYDKQRIIGSVNEEFRLLLTVAVGQILKNGLHLLGIEALERM